MKDWKDIHPDFGLIPYEYNSLIRSWEDEWFNYDSCKSWIDAGLGPRDAEFAVWLRDIKKVDSEWLVNHGNEPELRKEYQEDTKFGKYQTLPKGTEEEIITLILLALDAWKEAPNKSQDEWGIEFFLKPIIRFLADDRETNKRKYEEFQENFDRLRNFFQLSNPHIKKLNIYLSTWKRLLAKKKDSQDESTSSTVKEKPHECRTCEKQTFYNMAEFIQAHGAPQLEPSCWVYNTKQLNKKPPIFHYSWICKVCKEETHTKKCKYY